MSKYYLQEGSGDGVSWTEIITTLDETAAVKLEFDPGDRTGIFVYYCIGYRPFDVACCIGWSTCFFPGGTVYSYLCNLCYGTNCR